MNHSYRLILLFLFILFITSAISACSSDGNGEENGAKWDEMEWDKDKWN